MIHSVPGVVVVRSVVLAGCLAGCQELRTQLTDVLRVSAALGSQFGVQMTVAISNGNLSVTVPGEVLKKLPDAARDSLALAVARFAYAHYGHPETLQRVRVQFVTREDYGPVKYTRSEGAMSWPTSALSVYSTPRAAAHSSSQVVWIAIGARDAPARLDVDETRRSQGAPDGADTIVVRVRYDTPVVAPDGQRVASAEVHYVLTCATQGYAALGADVLDSAQRVVQHLPGADSLPHWIEPPGMIVGRAAASGYCRLFHPDTYNRARAH
jgi:hypothetical protein